MLSLIKFEFKKMLYSKSSYIILILGVILFLSNIAMGVLIQNSMSEDDILYSYIHNHESDFSNELEDIKGEYFSAKELLVKHNVDVEKVKTEYRMNNLSFEKNLSSASMGGTVLILVSIFTAILSSIEYSSGYIKNIVASNKYRLNSSISKWIISLIYTIVFVVIGLLISYLGAVILRGYTYANLNVLIKFVLLLILSTSAVNALIIMVANLFQKSNPTIMFSVLYPMGFVSLIFALIDLVKIVPFKFSDILLYYNLTKFGYNTNIVEFTQKFNNLLKVSLIYLIISLLVSTIFLYKKDIKTGE